MASWMKMDFPGGFLADSRMWKTDDLPVVFWKGKETFPVGSWKGKVNGFPIASQWGVAGIPFADPQGASLEEPVLLSVV